MNSNSSNLRLSKSEKYFVNDLYELIISSAADPAEMVERLSSTLREFVGAKEIVLFEYVEKSTYSHKMISHINIDDHLLKYYQDLAEYSFTNINKITQFYEVSNPDIEHILSTLAYSDVLIVPIEYKDTSLGCMHIFGKIEDNFDDQLVRLFTSIRPLLGVILENYKLFNNMDVLLKERTLSLDNTNRELESLINTVPDLIISTDKDLNINKIFNYNPTNYYFSMLHEGMNFKKVITPEQYDKKLSAIKAISSNHLEIFTETVICNHKENYLENRVMKTDQQYLHIIRNITESVLSHKKINFMNQYDQLTGLQKRSMLQEQYNLMIKNGFKPGILIIDMNGLKLLNDTLGFSEGDKYLSLLAKTCEKVNLNNGQLFRVGDDEIAFMIPNVTNDNMLEIIDNLNQLVTKLNETQFIKFPLSISAGYCIVDAENKGHEYLFSQAEANLNQDKLLHSESKKSSVVRTLAKAMEARDFITEGHADRMEELLSSFSLKLGQDLSKQVLMRLLGKFHDIGKVGISDAILFKPGKLTDEEMSDMEKHSEIGYRIALTAADLHPIADWILKHHEKFDGSGYPIGLKGDEIPLECRMVSIVDAYDAMTNNRPYREAMSKNDAVQELIKHSGSQFDPILVDFFIHNVI